MISGLICRRNGPAGIVLAGAPGVGKTRLAREALAAAQRRGALTRWAVATASARALPLGAFAATLGVVGPDPARLVRQASDALLAGAEKAGVIVGVDDAHLLDDLSATLVHCCGRSPRAMHCICGSWSTVSWRPAGWSRSLGYGGGRGSRRCPQGWWSWCRPGSVNSLMRSDASWIAPRPLNPGYA